MVVYHVEDDGQTVAVSHINEMSQVVRRAIGGLGREERGRVIAPRAVHGELVYGQRLDAVEPHVPDVRELAQDVLQVGRGLVELIPAAGKAPNVELVNNEVLEAGRLERRPWKRVGS